MYLSADQKIQLRAAANEWVSSNLLDERQWIAHSQPEYDEDARVWNIGLVVRDKSGQQMDVGHLVLDCKANVVDAHPPEAISSRVALLVEGLTAQPPTRAEPLSGDRYEFRYDNGLTYASSLEDGSVDLLLTDPPYGISNAYTCETQVPRRLRRNGSDFIMPRGNFGEWDVLIEPREWTGVVLPKVGGWVVTFCAQAQIGEYTDILKSHKFSAVGTLVWQKTNPVPFNHRYKPINAWEALVVGKRPGTKFNGLVVHNVFKCKSPSPQQRIHPTQKPLSLIEEFVELFSDVGDLIFDPFAGSATTVLAGLSLGRRVVACENNLAIFGRACERITSHLPL